MAWHGKAYRHRNDTASSHSIDSSMRAGPACCRDHACAFAMIFPAIFIRSPLSCPSVRCPALPFPARYSRPSRLPDRLPVLLLCSHIPDLLYLVSLSLAPIVRPPPRRRIRCVSNPRESPPPIHRTCHLCRPEIVIMLLEAIKLKSRRNIIILHNSTYYRLII